MNGAFTRHAVVREDQVYKFPEGFSFEEAALTEPFAAATHAVCDVARPQAGDLVILSGPGPIGLMCLKLLVAMGIRTIVAGVAADRPRLEAALRIGAAMAVDVESQNLREIVQEESNGIGAEIAIEAAGHPGSLRNCLESLRPMGRCVQAGIYGRDIQAPLDLLFHKQLELLGSVGYTPRTWDRVLRLFAQGRVRLADLVSDKLPLSEWQRGFEISANKSGLKVIIYPEA